MKKINSKTTRTKLKLLQRDESSLRLLSGPFHIHRPNESVLFLSALYLVLATHKEATNRPNEVVELHSSFMKAQGHLCIWTRRLNMDVQQICNFWIL